MLRTEWFCVVPWNHGLCYKDYARQETITCWIPFNFIFRIIYTVYLFLGKAMFPLWWEKQLRESFQRGRESK